MNSLMDIAVIGLWGLAFVTAWSFIGLACTAAVVGGPMILGRWRLARICAWSLVAALGMLWLSALADLPWLLPLPTRAHAAPIVIPIVAFWPALAAFLITRHRLTSRMSAETS